MKKKRLMKNIITGVRVIAWTQFIIAFYKARGKEKHVKKDSVMIIDAIDIITGDYIEDKDCEIIPIDDMDMKVIFNPYVHLIRGGLGCIAAVTSGGYVFVDNTFNNLSSNTKSVILHHEMGHIKSMHCPGVTYLFDRLKGIINGKVLPMELEADRYACDKLGKKAVISGLKELRKHVSSLLAKREITLRIKVLTKEVK